MIEKIRKTLDGNGIRVSQTDEPNVIRLSVRGYSDSKELDNAIKYYEELAKERYGNTGYHEKLANWLKELRDRRDGKR